MGKPKVGDKYVVIENFSGGSQRCKPEEGKVLKVGRKYFTVSYGGHSQTQFEIETSLSTNDIGWKDKAFTPEEAEDWEQREGALELMRLRGVKVEHFAEKDLATDQLVAIAKILDN